MASWFVEPQHVLQHHNTVFPKSWGIPKSAWVSMRKWSNFGGHYNYVHDACSYRIPTLGALRLLALVFSWPSRYSVTIVSNALTPPPESGAVSLWTSECMRESSLKMVCIPPKSWQFQWENIGKWWFRCSECFFCHRFLARESQMCSAEQAKPLFFGASHLASDLFKPGFFGVVATKKKTVPAVRGRWG